MLYRDLIQFEPIESVIQLRDAAQAERAVDLVRTYVISDRMADALTNVVIPQLSLDRPVDHKGILIVGNYGTGKSHLMSVLSAAAEFPDVVAHIRHEGVRAAAANIAGRFKVVRVELGGTERGLRDNVLEELSRALAEWGAPFTFPPATAITNNKDSLIQAVAGFREKYPDQGILIVVDELLDYLKSRPDRGFILDLSFLRELGELTALTNLRFVAGVQETLFDNPRFSFVSDQVRRVKDRFVQLTIQREDIAYVVAERLLRKDDEQLAWITDHLRRFAPLYPGLTERLNDFARLFPIHPAYIDIFDRLFIAEKRQALVTFRDAVQSWLDLPVPEDEPGILAYDHYWGRILDDAGLRTAPGVKEVVDKSGVLESKVRHAFTRPTLQPVALRLIHALSVQRLATDDIFVPLGPTAAELRDDLLLHLPLPQPEADFLLDQVQVALREIIRTVSGQYISHNPENGQYYLDIKKDVDFDARIRERADALDDNELNRAFFDALRQVLNLSTTTYDNLPNIWFYELDWPARQVRRPGYLFFGLSDERSTAQPPRDFYVYFAPVFGRQAPPAPTEQDEALLALRAPDPAFVDTLRLYAGARALANESAAYREIYQDKAMGQGGFLRRLTAWLNENLAARLEATYEGETRPAREVLAGMRVAAGATDDLIRRLAAHLLEPWFEERYPDYPAFTELRDPISEAARPTAAREAINFLTRGTRTALGEAVLRGLELLDDDGKLRPDRSRFARRYLGLLHAKPENQVVNRGEVIQPVGASPAGVIEKDTANGLEPEWVAVVLLALVQNGDVTLTVDGKEALDAGNLPNAALLAPGDLANFRHYARTKAVPVERWARIFEVLGLTAGLIRDETQREAGVRQLQDTVAAEQKRVAELQGKLGGPVQFWNQPLFNDRTLISEGGVVESGAPGDGVGQPRSAVSLPRNQFDPDLRVAKLTLEKLARYNTVGKLRNLDLQYDDIDDLQRARAAVERLEKALEAIAALNPLASYLAEAMAYLPPDHPWLARAAAARDAAVRDVRLMLRGDAPLDRRRLAGELEGLKRDYRAAYAELHRASVPGPTERDRRARLEKDPRLKALQTLVEVDLLKENQPTLAWWTNRLAGLRVCAEFHDGLLESSPLCKCGFRPDHDRTAQSPSAALDDLDTRLDGLLTNWRAALRAALTGEGPQASIHDMTPAERRPIEQFLAAPDDALDVPAGFVQAANRALRGITAVAIQPAALIAALSAGGLPCTMKEMIERFGAFLGQTMRGHDEEATRLTLSDKGER